MKLGLQLFALLLCISSCFSAPVPYAESLRKLEELKTNLAQLEETLRSFDNQLQSSSLDGPLQSRELSPEAQAILDKHQSLKEVIAAALAKGGHTDADEDTEILEDKRKLSPEDQALLDKYKSLAGPIGSELAKDSHTDADEDAEIPDAEQKERRDAAKMYREFSPEEQELLDKYKSLQGPIAAEIAKVSHTDADEDAEIPDAAEAEDKRDLVDKFKNLSPEDKALLQRFKSKLQNIDSILDRSHPSANDEDAEIDDAEGDEVDETVARRGNGNVFTYMSNLPEEDQKLLMRMRSKLPNLQQALEKKRYLEHDAQKKAEEAQGELSLESSEAETVQRQGNGNVFTYMSNLPEDDQKLLMRMRSKLPHLQQALEKKRYLEHDAQKKAEEAEGELSLEASAEEGTVQRRANVYTYMKQLSDDDQQLLRRMKSKMPYLQMALEKKNNKMYAARKRAEEEEESLVSDSEEDDKLKQFEQSLSPDDLALLKAMKSKLHFLKEALHAQRPNIDEEESASDPETDNEPAGPLEERRDAKMDGWNEQPLSDANLGIEEADLKERCACQKHEGSGKRCACDKELEERCPKCHNHAAILKLMEERCPTCHKDKTPDVVVEEVENRLMNDIEFAKAKGVSVAELIERIKAKTAERVVNEERELELLGSM